MLDLLETQLHLKIVLYNPKKCDEWQSWKMVMQNNEKIITKSITNVTRSQSKALAHLLGS